MADLSKEKIELYFFNIITDKRNGLLEILIKVILFGLSCVYRVILEIRYICFKMGIICSASTKVKVISIGNITVGGTGKTPLVEAIIEKIGHEKGKVAVITRGYKKDKKSIVLADEPQMLKETFCELPVIINKDRIAGIDYALKHYQSQWVVLDDAFGNLSVKKDLNIVCIDCNNPFGNGHLLPRGIMRLPFSYLKEADVFVLTSSEIGAANIEKIERKLKKHNKKAKLFKANHVPQFFNEINSSNRRELDYIQGKKVAVISGIAGPERFIKTLENLKADIYETFIFGDHHDYSLEDFNNCIKICKKEGIRQIVTTAKDAVKLRRIIKNRQLDVVILVLKVKLVIKDDEKRFSDIVSTIYSA